MATSASSQVLARLQEMDRAAFTAALGEIFEDSPWVAQRAWDARPFPSLDALHRTMMAVVEGLPREEQVAFLGLHPDLAGKAARAGAMSDASVDEQRSAGLGSLTDDEYERFSRMNAAYREKYGFPFIVAVRNHTRESILAAFETRLEGSLDDEVRRALAEVGEITRMRLETLDLEE